MGRLRATTLLLVALAAGLLLAACGSNSKGELLPGTTADQINANLDLVRESNEEGNCEKAEVAVAEVSDEVDELTKVNKKLKAALSQGAEKLSEVVSHCGQAEREAEEKKAEEAEAKEQEQLEAQEEEQAEEEEREEEAQQEEEAEEKAKEKAEKEAEQPEPPTGGEESKGKGKEGQEETVEPPTSEEEVTPPGNGGSAGGIGPGASVEGEG
jgi:nucleoid-associated protein YgaU